MAIRGKLVEDARVATQAEIDAYYQKKITIYDRNEVTRLSVPRVRSESFDG